MKTFYASLMLSLCATGAVFSQVLSNSVKGYKPGIYFSSEDFQRNQPTEIPQDCAKTSCFQVYNDFGYANLKVKTESASNNIYPAGTIFAFVDCYGRIFRFFETGYYQVLEIGAVNLFVRMDDRYFSESFIPESEFYFSTTLDGELMPLERARVIESYGHFPEFSQLVDQQFYPNVSLKRFNQDAGIYEINRAFHQLTAIVAQR